MLHVAPTSTVAHIQVCPCEAHPDALLLALSLEFDKLRRAYRAYDRDMHALPSDPDYEEAQATSARLHRDLDETAKRILALRPATADGLLVVARAAAFTTESTWDIGAPDAGQDGRLLRTLATDLFCLAGVDWPGRPLPTPPAALPSDRIFEAIAHSRATLEEHIAASNAPDADTLGGDARISAAQHAAHQAWQNLLTMPPATAAGIQALARHASDFIERGGPWDEANDASAVLRAIGAADLSHDAATNGRSTLESLPAGKNTAAMPDPVTASTAPSRPLWMLQSERSRSSRRFGGCFIPRSDPMRLGSPMPRPSSPAHPVHTARNATP